jgi:hypothetical protein
MNLVRVQRRLIIGAVALTPIFNIGELAGIANGAVFSQIVASTPILIKAVKDIAFVAIILCGVIVAWRSRKLYGNVALHLLLFTCLSAFVASLYIVPPLILLTGIRSILPLLAIAFIWRSVDFDLQRQIAFVLGGLLVIAFALQLYEFFFFPGIWGQIFGGFNKRNPGFFLIPSTMGSFACIVAYYAYCYLPKSVFRTAVVTVISPLSIFLTASGTALITIVLFAATIFFFRVRERLPLVVVGLAVICVGIVFLPTILSRPDIYTSLFIRIGLLADNIGASSLIASNTFGFATNASVSLIGTFDITNLGTSRTAMIADSTLTSFMINFGILASFFYILLFVSVRSWSIEYAAFLSIMVTFSLTVIVVESFPLSLLLAVNLIYLGYLRSDRLRTNRASGEAPISV